MSPQSKISTYFTLREATKSAAADRLKLSNMPNDEDLAAIGRTAFKMDDVRELLGGPVTVTSWYRNETVNKAVGGVSNSQHRLGEAVDFVCPSFGSPAEICAFLRSKAGSLDYDQLILEPTWVHISFITSRVNRGRPARRQYLDLSKGK